MLGGLYLSFYRFFCTSLPTFSVGLFRFSFVKFNIIQDPVFVNTFLKIFLFIFNILDVFLYFYIFRHILIYFSVFLAKTCRCRDTCNEPGEQAPHLACLPGYAMLQLSKAHRAGFRKPTAVAVSRQENNRTLVSKLPIVRFFPCLGMARYTANWLLYKFA